MKKKTQDTRGDACHCQQVCPNQEGDLDNKEHKKDKKLSQSYQPNTSIGNDKKRKHDHSVANVEPGEFEVFHRQQQDEKVPASFERVWSFPWWNMHLSPTREAKDSGYNHLQCFAGEVLMSAKKTDQDKKPKDPKGDFPKARKEVNYIFSWPDSYESKRKQKLTTC
jgi:hypothetical protein